MHRDNAHVLQANSEFCKQPVLDGVHTLPRCHHSELTPGKPAALAGAIELVQRQHARRGPCLSALFVRLGKHH